MISRTIFDREKRVRWMNERKTAMKTAKKSQKKTRKKKCTDASGMLVIIHNCAKCTKPV